MTYDRLHLQDDQIVSTTTYIELPLRAGLESMQPHPTHRAWFRPHDYTFFIYPMHWDPNEKGEYDDAATTDPDDRPDCVQDLAAQQPIDDAGSYAG